LYVNSLLILMWLHHLQVVYKTANPIVWEFNFIPVSHVNAWKYPPPWMLYIFLRHSLLKINSAEFKFVCTQKYDFEFCSGSFTICCNCLLPLCVNIDMCRTPVTVPYQIPYHFDRTVAVTLTRSVWMVCHGGLWVSLCGHVLWKWQSLWKMNGGNVDSCLEITVHCDYLMLGAALTAYWQLKYFQKYICHF